MNLLRNMRPNFFKLLYDAMKANPDIWCIVGDLGYGGVDKIQKDFPDRFVNCGAAEFSMVGIAAGLALEGKIPFTYTITPFYYRAFEMIRTYINHESIPIIMVAAGRKDDYKEDGISHTAEDDKVFKMFKNIQCRWPESNEDMEESVREAIEEKRPFYINLSR